MAGTPSPRTIPWVQANLNHCRAAQELMFQTALQWEVGLWIVAEPYRIPRRAEWARSTCGSAAIWGRALPGSPPFSALQGGEGFAAAHWGELTVVGVYFPPRRPITEFRRMLAGVRDFVAQQHPRPTIMAGDFNVHALCDGRLRDDLRGDAVSQWAAVLGLRRLPQGSEDTCVRWQGASRVDHAFANPAAEHRVTARKVLPEVETMSDHRYIRMDVSTSAGWIPRPGPQEGGPPRWVLRRLDQGVLRAMADATAWSETEPSPDVGEEAERLRGDVARMCDASMPRAKKPPPRREARWWSPGLSELRFDCGRLRRLATRARAGQADEASLLQLRECFRAKRDELREAIAEAQTRCWKEFLSTLDRDPWGRPYKWVMSKLRPWAPPLVETMDPQFLEGVLDALFPADAGELVGRPGGVESSDPVIWSDDMGVSGGELAWAMHRLGAKCTAPGPDGIPGRVWVLLQDTLGARLRQLYDNCLRLGRFPPVWKRARLVLLPKVGKPADSPSAYRPICLLDEAGKLFERIINARLVDHLSRTGPDLADSQYGFRGGRSTVDAIDRLRTLAEESVTRGGCALAVSLDIANAFNSLPWDRIRSALEKHQVPAYLREVVQDYLCDRWVEFVGRDGKLHRRGICRGVPQGSVLGPTLWNLGYDSVLRVTLPRGVSVICYADDTLVFARGRDWEETRWRAEEGTARVVCKIQSLGLRVAVEKTEVLHFRAPRSGRPRGLRLRIGGSTVGVGDRMKYLGLILDPHWRFEGHFDRLAPRLVGIAAALRRILPNTGGPRVAVRRLHAGVVRSVASYGAPIWARDLARSFRSRALLRRAGRLAAIRVARLYKTTSADAAHLLAGIPPFDLLAEMYAVTYYRKRILRREIGDAGELERAVEASKCQAWQSMLQEWKQRLADSEFGQRTVGAILPCFDAWLDGGSSRLTYRLGQVLSGHGCFGNYLFRIKKETTPRCHQCGAARDSAQHTLEECPFFEAQRRVLRAAAGQDLSLPGLIRSMLGSDGAWEAASSFCEEVMLAKEEAERGRRPRGRRGRITGDPLEEEESEGSGGGRSPPPPPPPPRPGGGRGRRFGAGRGGPAPPAGGVG